MRHRHGRAITGTARGLCAGLVALALLLAPLIVTLSHTPTDALASEVHGWHGHSHDAAPDARPDTPHDATDHEHQVTALAPGQGAAPHPTASRHAAPAAAIRAGIIRDGPRRPPRTA